MTRILVCSGIGLALANYGYQLLDKHLWLVALERTSFQFAALFAVWLATLGYEVKP